MAWLRRFWWVVAVVVVVLFAGGMAFIAHSAIQDGQERRASRARIEKSAAESERLARQVRDQGVRIEAQNARIEEQNATLVRIATAIDGATSQEARDRSAAALAGAITDLRRSIDCAELDDEATYPACAEVAARMDAIRSGADPFTRPPAQGGP